MNKSIVTIRSVRSCFL